MRPNLKSSAIAALTALALISGCSAEPETRMPGPGGGGTGGGEPIPIPMNQTAKYAGVYAAVAPLDLTQNGVLPGALGPALNALIELHDHPGKAIIDIIMIADIPTVSDAVKALPGFVRDLLASLLDQLIQKEVYANVPIIEQIANVISGVTELAKTIETHQALTIHTPTAGGTTSIDHQVTDVGFKLLSKSTLVTFNANEKAMAHTTETGTIKAHANAPVADADLTLAGGKMTLPFGELLLQAAGPLLFSQFGGAMDLKTALLNLVPCHDWAQWLSDQLSGYLSPALVEGVCVAAIGVVSDQVTKQIDAIVFKDVQISAGTAYLLDVSQSKPLADYQSDRVSQGKWNWSFSIAGASTTVPSSFEGDRTGTAQ
jgi:hypothetical protein